MAAPIYVAPLQSVMQKSVCNEFTADTIDLCLVGENSM